MTYQQTVSFYPAVALPGEPHSATQQDSLRLTCVSDEVVVPGAAVIQTEIISNSRVKVANVTAANFDINKLLIVDRDYLNVNTPYEGTPIGQVTPVTNASLVYPANCPFTAFRRGRIYSVVEKTIDTSLPVFIRVANPVVATPQLEGIGFFTDTDDGADTVAVAGSVLRWASLDNVAYHAALDPDSTAQIERDRISQVEGYGVIALDLRN